MNSTLNNLIWIDLEMTGLNTSRDYIIEIATIVTDDRLNIIAQGPVIAIYQPPKILDKMDEWNSSQHRKSGLLNRVSTSSYSVLDAERKTLVFLEKFVTAGKSPMCGSSICQDRRFMYRLMPKLEQYFHYRNLDVSSLKEMILRWYPKGPTFEKNSAHRALDDIHDSIAELKFYRQHFFIK